MMISKGKLYCFYFKFCVLLQVLCVVYRLVFVTILTQANATKLTQANYGNSIGDVLTLFLYYHYEISSRNFKFRVEI